VRIHPLDHGHDDHQEADRDDDAEKGEERAELGAPDGLERKAECLGEGHDVEDRREGRPGGKTDGRTVGRSDGRTVRRSVAAKPAYVNPSAARDLVREWLEAVLPDPSLRSG